jgi:hypothetical protein
MARASSGAVRDNLADRFGGAFTVKETTVTVGVVPVTLAGNNPERTGLTICNNGAADVYVATKPLTAIANGIRLGSGGGVLTVNLNDDSLLPAVEWFGLSAGAGNSVFVQEVYRDTLTPQDQLP